ncbi:MAG: hypothetical protein JO167_02465 [Alphaproteobacteria bacterium]|nr:hypothetical protein [Alphaproteobacteria bacterium]MBV9540105.1 hypothetical protein [Alphaproteobacteria bacterium]MBV9904298.1 hypothetical protein [Alphaproteobacteria bacterium]
MPRVSAAFFSMAALLLLAGMGLGEYMGAREDFVLAPVHAHLNLLGWATMALYGTFYALTRGTMSVGLAWTNFVLSSAGILAMAPLLFMLLTTGNAAFWGPLAGAAGGLSILGLLVFLTSVLRELFRRRSAGAIH